MKLLIAIVHPFSQWTAPDWLGPRIHQDFPQIEVEQLMSYHDLTERIRDAEIFFGWTLRGEQVVAAKKLRWIHSTAAAVHYLMSPELRASNIVVTNARSVHGPVVAEHTLALMFALAKRLPSVVRYQQQRHWAQQEIAFTEPHPRELAGSTLGLVGLGAIGSALAERARALGMRVLAVRASGGAAMTSGSTRLPGTLADPDRNFEVHAPSHVDEVIAKSDFLVLAAPVTEQTHHLLNRSRLALMKPHAYVINVARGSLIDEAALIEALRQHRIGGAALDVFVHEPLPADSPLWNLDNVLITPHTAAQSDQMWDRHFALIKENIRRYLAGEELIGLVDKQSGY